MRVIAVVSKKGGVGKSTTTINAAAVAARMGLDVGVIDLDPQASATHGLGAESGSQLADVLLGELALDDAWVSTEFRVRVVPVNIDAITAERQLAADPIGGLSALRDALASSTSGPDLVFLDTRPDEAHGTLNALVAADEVWIAAEPVAATLQGLPRLLEIINQIGSSANTKLGVGAIIPTKVRQTTTHREHEAMMRDAYGDLVTQNVPLAVKVDESHSARVPLVELAPLSPPAIAYREIIAKLLDTTSVAVAS